MAWLLTGGSDCWMGTEGVGREGPGFRCSACAGCWFTCWLLHIVCLQLDGECFFKVSGNIQHVVWFSAILHSFKLCNHRDFWLQFTVYSLQSTVYELHISFVLCVFQLHNRKWFTQSICITWRYITIKSIYACSYFWPGIIVIFWFHNEIDSSLHKLFNAWIADCSTLYVRQL